MSYAYWLFLVAGLLAGAAQAAPYPNVYGAPPEVLRGADWYRQCLRVAGQKPPREHQPAARAGNGARCDAGACITTR